MPMLRTVSLLTALVLAAPLTAAQPAKEIPPGLWEVTWKVDIPGMPPEFAAKMGNRSMQQCVKPGESRKWTEQRGPMGGREGCDPVEPKIDGNKISWTLKCANGTSGEGEVTHNGKDAYQLRMNVSSPRGEMKMTAEGKRVAETCEK